MCNPSVEPSPSDAQGSGSASSKGLLQQLSDTVDQAMSGFFGNLGESLGIRPYTYMLIAFLLTVACGSGFGNFTTESRSEKLWIPQGTEAQDDSNKYTSSFENPFRFEYVIVSPIGGGNILEKANLEKLMSLHYEIEDIEVTVEGESERWDLNSLCYIMPGDGHPCFVTSVLQYWDYNMTTLSADLDVQATLQAEADPADLASFLGDFVDNTASGGDYEASAAKITYFLENRQVVVSGSYEDLPAEAWEEEYLEVAGSCGGVSGLRCDQYAQRSFGDAFGAAITGDVITMNMGFLIIIAYLCINLSGRWCDFRSSKIALSMVSILAIGLAIASSMGFSQLCGWPYTPVHSVLPFVLLGLGVDDSFVIMNAFTQTSPDDDIKVRMRDTMSHAGVSITVTSMTDFVAFIISTTTSLPALASFCFYAATGILFLFLYQCILFGAMVVVDHKRTSERRYDCLCCIVSSPDDEGDAKRAADATKPDRISVFMKNTFGPFVVNKSVAPIITVVSLAMLGIGCWGASQLAVESNQLDFIPDDSYIRTTLERNDDLFGGDGTSVSLVIEEMDYFAKQSDLYAVKTALDGKAHLESTETAFDSWYHEFVAYNAAACYGACVGSNDVDSEGLPSDETKFYENLALFLGSAGARFESSVVMAEDGLSIKASKIGLTYDPKINGNADLQVEAMTELRDEVSKLGLPCYAYSFEYLTWETFIVIRQEMIQNVSLCMVAVFVITLILIAHPGTAGLVFFCVGCAIIEILGAMYFWGLVIDNVSVINLTLAVGLAVDYSAHVGHCFMVKEGTNKSERVIAALEDIGSAVLNGAISTFLAVVLLSGSKSYVFRVLFKQFFLTCTFGVFNGMVFLPVLLMYLGPAPYSNAGKGSHGGSHKMTAVMQEDKGEKETA